MIKQRLDMLAEQKKEVSNPPKQSKPIVHPLETEDKEIGKLEDSASLNVVLKRQPKDNHSTTEAQLEVTMDSSIKEDSVSIVSGQVDSVSIVSDPIDQPSGNQLPKLKLKKSRPSSTSSIVQQVLSRDCLPYWHSKSRWLMEHQSPQAMSTPNHPSLP